MGEFEDKKFTDFMKSAAESGFYAKDEAGRIDAKIRKYEFAKGESLLDLNVRARNFIWDDLVHEYIVGKEEEYSNGKTFNLLIVTHGLFISEMMHSFK